MMYNGDSILIGKTVSFSSCLIVRISTSLGHT